jgi:hypothetical protein
MSGARACLKLRFMETIRVQRDRVGRWEVAVAQRRTPIRCETLDDAKRIGHVWAARRHPCELIVCDAYHRVIERELIDGRGKRGGNAPRSGGRR